MKDLISVIIPVYKVEEYLGRCVNSILEQLYNNLEIILVDDGSPDNCGRICDEYAKKDDRVKVIHKKNGGLSDARNVGINEATGKYLVFVDSDDYVTNDYISYLYNIMKGSDSDIGICKVKVVNDGNEKSVNNKKSDIKKYTVKEAFENLLYDEGIEVAAYGKIYPRNYFSDIEFPVGQKYEDVAIIYKLFEKANLIAYGDKECYYYFRRLGSISQSGFNSGEIDYIQNTEKMLNHVEKKYTDLEMAVKRFRLYSKFRILRILLFSKRKDEKLQQETVRYIRNNYKEVLRNRRSPIRDKFAIITLLLGVPVFKMVWYLYSKATGRII